VKSLAQLHGTAWLALLFVGGSLSAKDGKPGVPAQTAAPNAGPLIELRGKVVKLPGETNAIGFKTEGGVLYPLVRNQKSEALFTDTNLATKTLIVKGRVQPGTRALEITGNLYSWRDGKQREIYYYCDICAIKTSEPGLCMCCREPMKLVEDPE
jgi:hypothetical protein